MLTGFRFVVPCSGLGLYDGVDFVCVAGTSGMFWGLAAVGIVALLASVSKRSRLVHMVLTDQDWKWLRIAVSLVVFFVEPWLPRLQGALPAALELQVEIQ
jgi:uncharacterized membrane protein YbhN (UPF0104 family)